MWFDGQADRFDDCSGFEPAGGRSIAQAVLDLSGCSDGDIILDVGAGTGAVGLYFADLPNRYLGLDLSAHMLHVFRRKLEPWPPHLSLVRADGDRLWPVADHALAVVFASRVAHHLRVRHFVQEVVRVCRSGGCLLLGQVTRDADSLPSRLQQQKRTLLAEHGLHPRAGGRAVSEIMDACSAQGADALGPVTAAQWIRASTPRQLLTAWTGKPQLNSSTGDSVLTVEQRATLVNALTDWAWREFGDLDSPQSFSERYTLQGVRLP
jgi:ubiquinone/menaquinone biosynthesis C-methylase UbiE